MNTRIRLLLALALFAAMVVAGIGAPSWADKLGLGAAAPAASGQKSSPPAGGRPQGTAETTSPVVQLVSDQLATVGSCATVLVKSAPADVQYTASVVSGDSLAATLPGTLLSCGIKVEATPGATLGAVTEVCFPIPLDQAGFAYYWNGTTWVKTTLDPKDSQSCVDVPASAGNPAFAGLFDK